MAAIDTRPLPSQTTLSLAPDWRVPELWVELARQTQAWWLARGIPARDAVVLLPFAALLTPLRHAFAAAGGWQPRVETPLTLAATLAPPPAVAEGLWRGDLLQDRLCAARLLLRQPWAEDWAARDASGFDRVTTALLQATQQFCAAAARHHPAQRALFWDRARAALNAAGPEAAGPAAMESALLQLALEWALLSCRSAAAPTDVLFTLQPAAWVLVAVGGEDSVAEAVCAASPAPTLRWRLDPTLAMPSSVQNTTIVGEPDPDFINPDLSRPDLVSPDLINPDLINPDDVSVHHRH